MFKTLGDLSSKAGLQHDSYAVPSKRGGKMRHICNTQLCQNGPFLRLYSLFIRE